MEQCRWGWIGGLSVCVCGMHHDIYVCVRVTPWPGYDGGHGEGLGGVVHSIYLCAGLGGVVHNIYLCACGRFVGYEGAIARICGAGAHVLTCHVCG